MCRSNAVSGATYGIWLDKATPKDCTSSLDIFQDNTAHSNSIGGFLVTAEACSASSLPSASFSDLTAYKHSSSGIVIDYLEGALLEDSVFLDNER